jgi:hypothetical protein
MKKASFKGYENGFRRISGVSVGVYNFKATIIL